MKKTIYSVLFIIAILFLALFLFRQNKNTVVSNQNYSSDQQSNIESEKDDAVLENNNNTSVDNFEVPILMYHYIRDYNNSSDPIGINLSVSPQKFRKQIAWFKNNNYETVSTDYLSNPYLMQGKPIIIITFDDGYEDAYKEAFPTLQSFGFKGIFYLIVNKIDSPGYLTWDEILEMKEKGMIFGSHTLNHYDLTNLSGEKLNQEILESKNISEKKLGVEIDDFCYPSGKYDSSVIEILKNNGYKTAVTTKNGIDDEKTNLLELKRIRMTNEVNLEKILK